MLYFGESGGVAGRQRRHLIGLQLPTRCSDSYGLRYRSVLDRECGLVKKRICLDELSLHFVVSNLSPRSEREFVGMFFAAGAHHSNHQHHLKFPAFASLSD